MRFNGFHHIGLIVNDVEKSFKFYTEGLGGKLTFQFPMDDSGKPVYLVDLGGNAVVELIPKGNEGEESNARWAHIAVNTDDAEAAYAAALAAGAKPQGGSHESLLGTRKVLNPFVMGPDGELIEFFQPL